MGKFGDPRLQAEMSRLLRDVMRQLSPRFNAGFILIGIPTDNTPRVVHNLENQADAYVVMEQLVKGYRTPGGTESGPATAPVKE